jgi:putative membrane protein
MHLKTLAVLSVFIAMAAIGLSVFAQPQVSSQTTDFVHKISMGNKFEIDSSKLAINKTSAKDVKSFAEMMVSDHTQIGDQLKKALASSGTGLTETETLDSDLQKELDQLTSAPPTAFDNLYVQAQSRAHDEAVTLVANYAESGDDVSLKKFASDTLPILKKHQDAVHTLSQGFMSTNK